MKKYLLFTLILLISSSFKPTSDFVFDLHFEPSESLLSENSYQLLDEAARLALMAEYGYQLGLEIFTTDEESLNRERVDEILDYLADKQVKIDKILYYSDLKHIPEDVKLMKDWNFVRLNLIHKQPLTVAADTKKDDKTQNAIPKWAEKVVDYQKNEEHFEVSNFAIINIKTADGSSVKFEPESFVFENGAPVTDPIKITTKYATTKDAAFLEDLTTVSNGELLESQGMMYVNATANGRQLRLKEGTSFEIRIKSTELKNDFQAFNGTRNKEDGQINWFLANDKKVELKRESDDYHFYKLERMSNSDIKALEAKRELIIENWRKRGVSKKNIRKRLAKYKKQTKERDKRLRKRRKSIRRHKDKKQPVLRKSQILGQTKYHYVEYEKEFKNNNYNFYQMKSNVLGWSNIDKLMEKKDEKPPCDLLVKANDKTNVKVVFSDYFGVFTGILNENGFIFPNFPSTLRVTIVAAEKLPNGQIRFAYEKTRLEDKTVTLTNYKTVSEAEFISFVKKLS